jgi:translation initiation factor 2 beta subunit (eIF-2beta)/eIF-5
MTYEELEKKYEREYSIMSTTPEGVRYLKLRTLIDVETLKASELLRETFSIKRSKIKRASIAELRKNIFLNEKISDDRINELLRKVYEDLKLFRAINLEELKTSLSKIANEGDKYWNAWNTVYRDNIRQHIQHHFVRTLSIQSYEELLEKIDKELDPVIKGYTIISWFNQWSSAIIEQFILSHPKVIPTARRIDRVDFFFLNIPIDLKITFIPTEYITLSLKNNIISNVEQIVDEIQNNPQRLVKWLYENQGEPRFSDSHRLFVVVVDARNLERSWKLKASFNLIQEAMKYRW